MKKVGIIGCGNIAQIHGWVLQHMEDVELISVCDLDRKKAQAVAAKYGKENTKVFTNWHALCSVC